MVAVLSVKNAFNDSQQSLLNESTMNETPPAIYNNNENVSVEMRSTSSTSSTAVTADGSPDPRSESPSKWLPDVDNENNLLYP